MELNKNEMVLKKESVGINNFLKNSYLIIVPLAKEKEGVSYDLSLSDRDEIVIDEERLRNCLINLINNAFKFMKRVS